MRYFTSDLHLGSRTLAELRGFGDDVEAYDACIASMLAALGKDDELWLLGDLCEPDLEEVVRLREMIPCTTAHVVIGNHDSRTAFATSGLFDSVEHYGEVGTVSRDGYRFVMSHYPMLHWNGKVDGAYMLHGHIHSLPVGGYRAGEPPCPEICDDGRGFCLPGCNESNREAGIRRYDVGVDANRYRLVSAEEIVAFFAER